MTRINLVHPSKLCDQHLLAELRELPRIPNGVISGRLKMRYVDAPARYVLGAGHVKFFVNKLRWLWMRYAALMAEAKRRRFYVEDRFPVAELQRMKLLESSVYTPSESEVAVNVARITERTPKMPRMYGRRVDHAAL